MRDGLIGSVGDFNILSGSSRTQFGVAVEEVLANAFYQGNLEVDSRLNNDVSSGFNELACFRRVRPSGRGNVFESWNWKLRLGSGSPFVTKLLRMTLLPHSCATAIDRI